MKTAFAVACLLAGSAAAEVPRDRSAFNVGSAVRVNVENDEIHIKSRAGTRAAGRLTADR